MGKVMMIRLPNTRRVSLPAYLHAWRTAKAFPDQLFTGWGDVEVTGTIIHNDIVRGLHDRINKRAPK